jgi:hypothetical protein
MPTKTPNPEKSISAAFDSVALINKLILETVDDKKKANVERNSTFRINVNKRILYRSVNYTTEKTLN